MARYPERFARRLLTDNELVEFQNRGLSLRYLASRFAAKEAASKALGTGIAKGLTFQSIEVVNDDLGKPELIFHGAALDLIKKKQIRSSLLSLSDEKKYVVAMVVLESS